ncbi:alpha/beta-hydrolase [Aulographum hederae CBS 113979]|uniref:Alpha/beta-hydrolase n=1 Tax=Aulographum hederae CBS 113979 TaxID=1176131 RepID=A0A6G1GNQ4_9PEZI|nr:alpha/beta-hydrolase [Aulographum hederae CBS 113979]
MPSPPPSLNEQSPTSARLQPPRPSVQRSQSSTARFLSQPISVQWRTALVRLPRAVPPLALKWTASDCSYPIIVDLPSRGKYKIPVYIFVPQKIDFTKPVSLPVVLDFHGGGFYLGSCLEQAPFCGMMANELNCIAISVDYRMGPIDQFPAALEDGEDVLRAILEPTAPGYPILRKAIIDKLLSDAKADAKTIRKAEARAAKKAFKAEKKALKKQGKKEISKTPNALALAPDADPSLAGTGEGPLSKTSSRVSELSSNPESTPSSSLPASRVPSRDPSRAPSRTPSIDISIDPTRVAISGFSSGGNLALNLGLSVHPPQLDSAWPCPFPSDHPSTIPLLLFYPSLDLHQLPSERTRPAHAPVPKGFWSETSDLLAPTYLPREQAGHPRASPGLADLEGLHDQARMLLVLPSNDSLAHQSEIWVKKVKEHRRGGDLRVERYEDMKHGWTQMPEGWLSDEEKRTRKDIFEKTLEFTRDLWGRDEMEVKG